MSILTLQRARELIANIPIGTARYDDDDIQKRIDTAECMCARIVGPLEPTVVTETLFSRGNGTALPVGPYIGPVTALLLDGVPETSWNVTVDGAGFARGLPRGVCTLTYTAGWLPGTLSPDVREAVEEQFKHVWSFRRGNTRTTDAERGAAHAMPYRVAELLEPQRWGRS